MKIVGLLSWFDEDPAMLSVAAGSACQIVDHLVAVDGRYQLYNHPDVMSDPAQYDAIADACQTAGVGCTLVSRSAPWDGPHGGEVAKRAHMFTVGEQLTAADDWYLVLDGDFEFVNPNVPALRTILQDTDLHVGEVMFNDNGRVHQHPLFFRALRGLTVTDRHWRFHVPGGPVLWDAYEGADRAATFRHVHVEHHDQERAATRRYSRDRYYTARDRAGVELAPEPILNAVQQQARDKHAARMRHLLAGAAGRAVVQQ